MGIADPKPNSVNAKQSHFIFFFIQQLNQPFNVNIVIYGRYKRHYSFGQKECFAK